MDTTPTPRPASKPRATDVVYCSLGEKQFGFEVNMFKGKMYVTGREMYQLDGVWTFGRNGVSINITDGISDAMDFVRYFLLALSKSIGKDYEDLAAEVLNGEAGDLDPALEPEFDAPNPDGLSPTL